MVVVVVVVGVMYCTPCIYDIIHQCGSRAAPAVEVRAEIWGIVKHWEGGAVIVTVFNARELNSI